MHKEPQSPKFIISSLHRDRPKHEKDILEKEILRSKLRKLIEKDTWRSVMQLEKVRLETGDQFDLITELELFEKSDNDCKLDDDISTQLHATVLGKRPGSPIEREIPYKRPNSPNAANTSSSLPHSTLPDGTIQIGNKQSWRTKIFHQGL